MICTIYHPGKVMLRVILTRLVNQAKQILEEELACFRSHRSTTEQTFNLRHHNELHYNVVDFTKAFDRIWHEDLWRTLKEYNIDKDNRLVEVIKSLYDEATSATLLNGNSRDLCRTTVRARQGCPLSPVSVNTVLEKIMQKTLTPVDSSENDCFADDEVEVAEETDTPLSSVSIGG